MSNFMFHSAKRSLSCCQSLFIKNLNNAKGKSKSSQEWLLRQINDSYVEKAKMENYSDCYQNMIVDKVLAKIIYNELLKKSSTEVLRNRCRSAFKLLEMNKSSKFLLPGQVVVDIGAAPGSWTQVAVKEVNSNNDDPSKPIGAVFALDRLQIYPIEGATILSNLDFQTEEASDKLKELLNGKKVDVVLSDMAPNATGIRNLDQENIISLCYKVFRFAAQVSKKDATLLVKVWDGAEVPVLELDLERFYKSVKFMKPSASRMDSAEKFLLARGFKGLQE